MKDRQRTAKARAARSKPPRKGLLNVAQVVKRYGSIARSWRALLTSGVIPSVKSHGMLWVEPGSVEHFIRVYRQAPRGRGRPRTLRVPSRGK